MRVAVFSDTHMNTAKMLEAVRKERPDVMIHLGDLERDTECLVKAFITHGHLYNVDWNTDSLVYAAMEEGCSIAMFGHTHQAVNGELGSVKLLNPGTAGKGLKLTYAMVDIFENGGIACEIRDMQNL